MAKKIDLSKEIYEGWTAQDFVNDLAPQFEIIMAGHSWRKPFKTRAEVKAWCMDNQSYYKKYIPAVVDYFCQQYNIR